MPITKFTGATNTIQSLSDRPNQNEGLTAAALKIKFDQFAIDNKAYINDVLTVEVDNLGINKSDELNIHKTSNDHDGRYYTETEINNLISNIQISNSNIINSTIDRLKLNFSVFTSGELQAGVLNTIYASYSYLQNLSDNLVILYAGNLPTGSTDSVYASNLEPVTCGSGAVYI